MEGKRNLVRISFPEGTITEIARVMDKKNPRFYLAMDKPGEQYQKIIDFNGLRFAGQELEILADTGIIDARGITSPEEILNPEAFVFEAVRKAYFENKVEINSSHMNGFYLIEGKAKGKFNIGKDKMGNLQKELVEIHDHIKFKFCRYNYLDGNNLPSGFNFGGSCFSPLNN